jgi:hypothetical protein
MAGSNKNQRRGMAMFRLDYLSCFLTVVATILLGRKMWIGFVISGVNSLIVCVIGLHTSQYGFIPADLFCICINAFNVRAWLKVQKIHANRPLTQAENGSLAANGYGQYRHVPSAYWRESLVPSLACASDWHFLRRQSLRPQFACDH